MALTIASVGGMRAKRRGCEAADETAHERESVSRGPSCHVRSDPQGEKGRGRRGMIWGEEGGAGGVWGEW